MDPLAHRKATARIRVLGADGAPLKNRPVRFRQTSHRFLFGCGAFHAAAMLRAAKDEDRAFLRERMDKWLALFNYGTLPFYWGRYEPAPGRTDEQTSMAAAQWLKARGVTLKGHPLCWHTVCADWLLPYSDEEILRRQLERIRREVTAFRGVVDLWDVINEVVIMPDFDKYDNAVTRICRAKGRFGLAKEVFAAAKAAHPGATLLINDFNTSVAYEILIEGLLDAGVPISAIGIQSHQHQGYWGREKLEDVLRRFSRYGLPLHFTENTLISGDLMPAHIVDLNDFQVSAWPTTEEGEARQAREMTEMYTVLFEHPMVEAITAWDFVDDAWLHAPAGLLRVDNSEKPAYRALNALIHGAWETSGTLTTDENGLATLTGFRGGYRADYEGQTASFDLSDDRSLDLALR